LNHATPESKYWAGHYYIHNYNISGKEYEDDNRKNKKLLKNNKKAKDKLIQASELNHSVAQFELAHAIFEGRIKVEEERRFQYARELLEKSAENKYNMAIRRIAKYKREGSYGYERTKSVSSIELKSLEIKSENKNQFNSLKKKKSFIADNSSKLPTICNTISTNITTFPIQSPSSSLTSAPSTAAVRSKIPVKQAP
jgi:TPR repeat protein